MTRKAASAAPDAPRTCTQQEATTAGPAPWLKLVLSGLLALHVTAVFWAPFAFASRSEGPSPLADPIARALRPYIQFFFLDHGYSFFAPEVGPSHLVRYKVEFDDGREPLVGTFPDLKTQQPRLLYHRHFMMSETLHNFYAPPTPPPEPTPPPLPSTAEQRALFTVQKQEYQEMLTRWRHRRAQYELLWKSYEDHLRTEHGGSKVTLTRVEHELATPLQVQHTGRRLNAKDSYIDLPETPPARTTPGGER
jgi:hypothetical protein